jgi:polysaccharide pyruvyl transferase WcaK-like protein
MEEKCSTSSLITRLQTLLIRKDRLDLLLMSRRKSTLIAQVQISMGKCEPIQYNILKITVFRRIYLESSLRRKTCKNISTIKNRMDYMEGQELTQVHKASSTPLTRPR